MNDLLSSPYAMSEIVRHHSAQRKKYYTWGGASCLLFCQSAEPSDTYQSIQHQTQMLLK
jgi:hypothetical protein